MSFRDRAQDWLYGLVGGLQEAERDDYKGLVEEVGHSLACTLDQATLVDVLVHRVPLAMGLPGGALWMWKAGEMVLVGQSGAGVPQAGRWLAEEDMHECKEHCLSLARGYAILPLPMKGYLMGVWALAGRPQEDWRPEERRILNALGNQAILAVENVALVNKLRAKVSEVEHVHRRLLAAREQERAELARELHDGVIQDLIGLRYRLEDLQERRGDNDLAYVHTRVGVLVDELRRLCSDLRPPALDQLGLAAALRALARQVSERGLPVNTHLHNVCIQDEAAIGLYRIGQEALFNAWRHAGASKAFICLAREGGRVQLTVGDDGNGFDPVQARERGDSFGLLGMEERAEALGGELTIESAPGEGTRVVVRCDEAG